MIKDLFAPPFDNELFAKKKKIKRELMASGTEFIDKKIAILGGSTTHDIKDILELFLLHHGIRPKFYESEYNMYWQDAMFPNEELESFSPDIIFVHTSNRNITRYPELNEDEASVEELLKETAEHFATMWDRLAKVY